MLSFSILLYNLAIRLYGVFILIASLKNGKAQKWLAGRKNWRCSLEQIDLPAGKRIWFHCASLGEFEQAKPLIEKFRKTEGEQNVIILTFFSPSGYEIQKNSSLAHLITYLPLDTSENAKDFIQLIKPDLVFFTKYDFWYNYLQTLRKLKIPTVLFSANFRHNQIFFKWYGGLFKEMLKSFRVVFVQNELSHNLLKSVAVDSQISYDTRFDRVIQIANSIEKDSTLEIFKGTNDLLVAGSTWPKDEQLLIRLINEQVCKGYKFIIAPHEINNESIQNNINQLNVSAKRLAELNKENAASTRVLMVDSIGQLSSLYSYGNIAYIGGGFNAGIHNILEAAVFGLPILFGPEFKKSQEANDLVNYEAAKTITNYETFRASILSWAFDKNAAKKAGGQAKKYVLDRKGGADSIYSSTFNFLN
jgi:3-deoxy-D-manno-octulosonic-acid transferase